MSQQSWSSKKLRKKEYIEVETLDIWGENIQWIENTGILWGEKLGDEGRAVMYCLLDLLNLCIYECVIYFKMFPN